MEMRACEDTGIGEDLIPPIAPIALSLHDHFLPSRCSSCFLPLPPNPIPCSHCAAAVLYCSSRCSAADHHLHLSSGECRVLRSLPFPSDDSADLRAALRLLHSLAPLPLSHAPPTRLGGLQVGGLRELIEDGGEMAERIVDGGAAMSRARSGCQGGRGRGEGGVGIEEVALWAVVSNAVEVVLGEEGGIGIAVYGPRFSWFNHSCSPNALFRFEPPRRSESAPPGPSRVFPAGSEEETDAVMLQWERWSRTDSESGLCLYGPRIVARSIKPIKKDGEVCITYTDLLQPKKTRHLDLWSKYRFVCCCERCTSSPERNIDYIISCNARYFSLDRPKNVDADCDELAEYIDEVISAYMLDENPKACCGKLENLLSDSFQDKRFQAEKRSERKFKLHPLHYLSLNAYVTLASAYRIRAASLLSIHSGKEEALKLCRASAAYSLLLSCATLHLFLSDISLIANFTLFVINTGESIVHLIKCSMFGSTERSNTDTVSFASHPSKWMVTDNSIAWDGFEAATRTFLDCLSGNLLKSWPLLVQGLPYLENIEIPVSFSWLEITSMALPICTGQRSPTSSVKQVCAMCNHTEERCYGEDMNHLIHLAIHCLFYGKYLADICYGSQCYLVEHAENLLHYIDHLPC